MLLSNSDAWAEALFGHANLGDIRRTRRLVDITSSLAKRMGSSLAASCDSSAATEGAYRFMRNTFVSSEKIAEAGFIATAQKVASYPLLLALEDTTTLNFNYASVYEELGYIGTNKTAHGFLAHSVLLYAPDKDRVVGLLEQELWCRDPKYYGKKSKRKTTPYKEKESYKWQQASERVAIRLGEEHHRIISVCDREADIWDYLYYKKSKNQRFVIRAMHNRRLDDASELLFDLSTSLTEIGHYHLQITQRGGRKARTTQMNISYSSIQVKKPGSRTRLPLLMNYICCREDAVEGGLCWHLLTTEPITNAIEARQIVSYYERRWLIEEYHKAWKSGGTQVEKLRLQTRENLTRMVVILAFLAVRVFALRQGGLDEGTAPQSCETVMTPVEWKLLWRKREKKPLPSAPPSLKWACLNMAGLANWHDRKRTGRPGWIKVWEGWFRLQDMLEGYELAQTCDLMA